MNAQLKPLDVLAIGLPEYDNLFLGYEQDWIAANRTALRVRCADAALGPPLPEADFDLFCKAQHDVQVAIRDEFKQTLRMY